MLVLQSINSLTTEPTAARVHLAAHKMALSEERLVESCKYDVFLKLRPRRTRFLESCTNQEDRLMDLAAVMKATGALSALQLSRGKDEASHYYLRERDAAKSLVCSNAAKSTCLRQRIRAKSGPTRPSAR